MNIVGLDMSLTGTGIAQIDGSLVTVGSKSTEYTLAARKERLDDLYARIITAVARPQVVVIEAPSLGQRTAGHMVDRYGLWWRLVGAFMARGVEVIDLPPTTLKKYATGKGNATKIDMTLALANRTGASVRDDNQVDAAWLRYAGHDLRAEPLVDLPKPNRAALDQWRLERE